MTQSKEEKAKKEEERRRTERFAWLGPLLERRKARAEPIEDDDGEELEELKD